MSGSLLKELIGGNVKTKYIYLCYVDRYIGAFNPITWEILYAPSEKFVPFVQKILKEYPEYSPHCIIDKTIEKTIRDKINHDVCVQKCAQNLINNGK